MRQQVWLGALALATVVSCQESGGGGGVGQQRDGLERLATAPASLPAGVTWPELPPTGFRALALERAGETVRPVAPVPKENASRPAQVKLPAVSGQPFEVRDGAMAMRVTLRDQERVPGVVKGDAMMFARGYRGAHVVLRALADGVEDFITLDGSLAPRVEYDVELEGVDGVRLVENTLELLSKDGSPRLRMAPPKVLTGKRSVPVRVAVSGCAFDSSPVAPWGRPVTRPGSTHCRVALTWELEASGYPALLDPAWTTTGDLATGRFSHQLVKLPVQALMLACGGDNQAVAPLSSCELYNEVSGTWAATGSMLSPRANFAMAYSAPAATGPRVVAVGGESVSSTVLATTDVYNPAAGTWSAGAAMSAARAYFTATPLPNDPDLIVVVGGQVAGTGGCAGSVNRATTIWHYRISANTMVAVANMATGRALHNATPLTVGAQAGSILITGGVGTCCGGCIGNVQSAELIGANGTTVTALGNMIRAGRNFAATFELPSGQVRIAGGVIDTTTNQSWFDSELYTPGSGFSDLKAFPGNAQGGGWGAFGTLSNGNLLVGGGSSSVTADGSTTATFVYSMTSGTWAVDGSLTASRRGLTGGTTPLGRVIAVGGAQTPGSVIAVRRTELFDLLPNGSPCTGPGLCQSQQCVDGVCCNTACAGNCDACNLTGSVGTCTFQPNTFVCRASSGAACDVAETCTGSSATCPADGFAAAGTTCRVSAGACDVPETCPGGSPTCPADGFSPASTPCRPVNGACDQAESCTGTSAACPADTFVTGTVCRPANGACDVAESCTGTAATCPADGFATGTMCRPANGVCDVAESCDGTAPTCPADGFATGTVCRPGVAACDAPESCDGTGPTCPADALASSSTVCRPAAGPCDAEERCSGSTTMCGADMLRPAGVTCNSTYVCGGMDAGCPTSCTDSSQCATGSACVNSVCIGTLSTGAPCVQNEQCASNFCVDGVCCNTACDGACDSCALAGSVGTCTPSPAGSAGSPSCNPYVCDGASASCPTSCASSTQCAAGLSCAGGRCGNASGNGVACTADADCSSGFCVDGVCCTSRCGGGCDACDVPGAVGTCTVLGRGEPGKDPACAPFVCDGTNRECPTACAADADCAPPAFCQSAVCVDKTRGHVGFSCGGCASVDVGPLFALAGLLALRRRRAKEVAR